MGTVKWRGVVSAQKSDRKSLGHYTPWLKRQNESDLSPYFDMWMIGGE
jgi:hypothetical protein